MKSSLYRRLSALLVCLFCWSLACAQTGSWNPPGADLSFPRTLLKATQVEAVQTSLSTPIRYSIYAGLYSSINGTPPAGNTSSSERRNRATFAKNSAFVLLMDRKPSAGALTTLSATDRDKFVSNVKLLLENINTAVETYSVFSSSYTEWQWRSKELIDYMVAYDLLRGAGEPVESLEISRTKLQAFAGNLYKNATTASWGLYFFNVIKNNHSLMTSSALGLSAVVLNDVGGTDAWLQPTNWINTGLYNMDNVLWRDASRQSNPGAVAGYAEGPYYFKYAFLNCLPFIRSMGNFLPDGSLTYTYNSSSRSIRNPYYDPSYDLLYDWITAIQMPDGRYPALEDSYIDMGMPELALTGKSRYVNPMYFSNLAPTQLNSLVAQLRSITVDMRAAFLAANLDFTTPENARLTALPVSGNLVFRSGNDSLANYLHVYGKNGLAQTVTGGHNHGDAGSFILQAKGQLLALDPGYLSSTRRGEVGDGVHHNLVLADGAGPVIGSSGSTNDAEAFIQNTFSTEKLSYGEVRTAYQSANITRKTIFVRNAYYLMADFVSSSSSRTFTWQLHGYGLEGGTAATGTFTDSLATHKGIWQKNGVNLKAHVTATGGASSYGKVTGAHELTYNTTESHTTYQVHKSNVAQTQFLSLLHPFTEETASVKTVSNAQTAALRAAEGGYQDLAFAQDDSSTVVHSSLPETVSSDALLTFFSLDSAGNFAQAFVEQGRSLQYGTRSILQSTKRATISWQKKSDTEFNGYTSRATVLTVPLEEEPLTVTGSTISSQVFDTATNTLAITFSGPAQFQVTVRGTVLGIQNPLPVRLAQFSGKRQTGQVLLNWTTASETNNQGFEIWRQAEGADNFEIIGFVNGKGTSSVLQTYTFADVLAPATTAYYRLKQLDHDGTYTFSPVIAILGKAASQLLSVSPVPADGSVRLSFADPAKEVLVKLLNANGQLLRQQVFRQQAELITAQLPPGLYLLQAFDLAGQPVSETRKLVIRR
ncbi:T9SS type A sorting domain-containing protein [Botryobacter ruber]|uniref:T9SS type A sorting domain-containing protein n=1 Tax=Botryobacter ruber TaxID=2171629 RepID=UPI000E0CAE88|nr:heparinase II/III family protein [Botryobacter ruber]